VRDEAIVKEPAQRRLSVFLRSAITRCPAVSLSLNEDRVNRNRWEAQEVRKRRSLFIFPEQLFPVFDEADQHHHRRPGQAHKKRTSSKRIPITAISINLIVTGFLALTANSAVLNPDGLHSPLYEAFFIDRRHVEIVAAAAISAALLELPFPLAGPLPLWRTVFAWFGLVPLLAAILSKSAITDPRPVRRGFLLGYLCGFLWYMGNCYWVRDTMAKYTATCPLSFPSCC